MISEEESVAEADESVEGVGPVDDAPAADSGEELEAADDELEDEVDESEDEVEELESVGSASATPGVFATAVQCRARPPTCQRVRYIEPSPA